MIKFLIFSLISLNSFAADFKTGSDKPTEQLLQKIDKEVPLNEGVVLILVEAHADIRGSKESNVTLTEKRAENVKKLLESKGVKAKIVTVGKGEMKPVSEKHSDNRRVDITTFDISELCPKSEPCKKEKRNKNILSGYLINSRQGLRSNVQGLNGEVRSEFGNGLGIMYQREILDNLWIGGGLDTNKGRMLTIGVGF